MARHVKVASNLTESPKYRLRDSPEAGSSIEENKATGGVVAEMMREFRRD